MYSENFPFHFPLEYWEIPAHNWKAWDFSDFYNEVEEMKRLQPKRIHLGTLTTKINSIKLFYA